MIKQHNKQPKSPANTPEQLTLFPTMNSVKDVLDFAEAKLPINNRNDVVTLLGTYHNTLLNQLSKE